MKTVIIIPARMASQRFPNKPLALIKGIPMVQRVWEQSIKSNLGDVFVACSEPEVFELITNLGGKAIMTDPKLPSGTDRIYAALKQVNNFKSYIYLGIWFYPSFWYWWTGYCHSYFTIDRNYLFSL